MSWPLFDFIGFPGITDLKDEYWMSLFDVLEREQAAFLEHQDEFRSKQYRWPRDPLHTWSRLWEYPYVYHHLQRLHEQSPGEKLKVLDYGSGVTFFPFSVAKLGYEVTCADIDPLCAVDIPSAVKIVQHDPGTVNVVLINNGVIPVESESQDVVYCISVIEHIPEFEFVINEIHRILKPSGQFIVTLDIGLQGNMQLGVGEFDSFQSKLSQHFIKIMPERPVHPSNLLTSDNSPYHECKWTPIIIMKKIIKSILHNRFNIDYFKCDPYLTIYSIVLQKK